MIHLKVWESRESRRRRWWGGGGSHCVLGWDRKKTLMGTNKEDGLMPEKMEQQAVTHILLLQHVGSCWNTVERRDRVHNITTVYISKVKQGLWNWQTSQLYIHNYMGYTVLTQTGPFLKCVSQWRCEGLHLVDSSMYGSICRSSHAQKNQTCNC